MKDLNKKPSDWDVPTAEIDPKVADLANVIYFLGVVIDDLNIARRHVKENDKDGIRIIERAQDYVIQCMERFTSIRDQNKN